VSKVRSKRKIIGRFKPKQTIVRFEHPAEFFEAQQPDSTHILTCPECREVRFVDKRFVESLGDIGEISEAMAIGVVHRGCEVQMQIQPIKTWQNWQDVKESLER
jgi:hypothetical protein